MAKISRSHPLLIEEHLLFSQFLKGNNAAFTQIYNLYANKLMAYGLGWGFEREILKDAIQDVFYKLYFNRKAFKEVTNLKFYLIRSLKNRILDLLKQTADTTEIAEVNFFIQPSVLDELIAEEDRAMIQKQIETYLNMLTGRQREAVYLRFIEELDYEEIAIMLNMTAPAVRKLVCRAIARIREQQLSITLLLSFYKLIN
ncbi:sigma-70 family RNA polymerase sigma factor [uncultured Bacteroides sp.]|uniref:RNA polymerase sigma factor n=1 Tax=uncultured Bacteroides sp. TaxID=162156 RepID=UPI002AA6DC92|nr:sigma-70 family RNA polymerase sigma factor [uncultured Bacteroides sp.]